MRMFAKVLGALVVLGGLGALAFITLGRHPTIKAVEQQGGYFYRVKANYTLKATGEPIAFDFVMSCGIRVTHWRDKDRSFDGTHYPWFIGKALPNGAAMGIVTPGACRKGEVTGGTDEPIRVPDELMPYTIWYDDINDMREGWLYAIDDAYESPYAKIAFHGATITEATRAEWDASRTEWIANFKPTGMLTTPFFNVQERGEANRRGQPIQIATDCNAYQRLPMPPNIRDEVRQLLPDTKRPYHLPKWEGTSPYFDDKAFQELWMKAKFPPDPVRNWPQRYLSEYIRADGNGFSIVRRAGGGGLGGTRKHAYRGEIYPYLSMRKTLELGGTYGVNEFPRRVLIDGGRMRGFAYCSYSEDFRPFENAKVTGYQNYVREATKDLSPPARWSVYIDEKHIGDAHKPFGFGRGAGPDKFFEGDSHIWLSAP